LQVLSCSSRLQADRRIPEASGAVRSAKAFGVHDPPLREAVYSCFKHIFVYADEQKARFYFEKPYWERTPEEMKAAGI
jgi:hypothetical protein